MGNGKEVSEVSGYHVGQHGQFEVLNEAGTRRFWVEGEIVSFIRTPQHRIYALIRTPLGTGDYRVW